MGGHEDPQLCPPWTRSGKGPNHDPPEAELWDTKQAVNHGVASRRAMKASVHAVLAKQGPAPWHDGSVRVGGTKLLAGAPLDAAYRLRVNALLRLIDAMDFEIRAVAGPLRVGLAGHAGFQAIQAVPGVGPMVAAIFVAEQRTDTSAPSTRLKAVA